MTADIYTGADVETDEQTCASCGGPLGLSIDDRPDWPTGPMCGDCYQARQMDDEIAWSELDSQ